MMKLDNKLNRSSFNPCTNAGETPISFTRTSVGKRCDRVGFVASESIGRSILVTVLGMQCWCDESNRLDQERHGESG